MSRWRNKPLEAGTKFSTRCSGEHQELCLWGDTRWLRHLVNLWIRQKPKTSVSQCFPQSMWTQMGLRSQEHDWVILKQRASSLKSCPAAAIVSLTRSRTGNKHTRWSILKGSSLEPTGNMLLFCHGAFRAGPAWKLSLDVTGKAIFFWVTNVCTREASSSPGQSEGCRQPHMK